jgi:adenylyltransferase/sulfurtransferase
MTQDMEDRYSRQVRFSGIGAAGQERLRAARVTVVGCGALGSVSSEILARAGIGNLTIIDRDYVELSNLQRQSLFTEADVKSSKPKSVAAQETLRSINSEINIKGVVADLTYQNIAQLCSNCDLVVDGSDNFEVRFLINDFCVHKGLPWVYAAALGSYGISFAIIPGRTACLRCFFQEMPESGTVETCETAGILGSVIHLVSAFQTSQVIKILIGDIPAAKMLQVDIWEDKLRMLSVKGALPSCECCQKKNFRFLDGEEKTILTKLCGRNAVQLLPLRSGPIDLEGIAIRLGTTMEVKYNDYLLRTLAGDYEIVLFSDGRAIVKGTDDYSEARAVFSKYIGS